MEKNLMINIAVDSVPLNQLETLQGELESVFSDYPDKRITITIQDQPLVKFG